MYPGDDFWDELDKRLTWIREAAGYNKDKIAKYALRSNVVFLLNIVRQDIQDHPQR